MLGVPDQYLLNCLATLILEEVEAHAHACQLGGILRQRGQSSSCFDELGLRALSKERPLHSGSY